MSMAPILFEEMTWLTARDVVERGLPIVIPTGSLEQHGPHLPLGTDALIAFELAKRAAAERPLIIFPPVFFGAMSHPKSGGGRGFPGSIGIPGRTLIQLTGDLIQQLLDQGLRRIVILNGHFENAGLAYEALDAAIPPGAADLKALLINWWDLVRDEDMSWLFAHGFPGWEAEHAGHCETSLMEDLRPDLVHADQKVDDAAQRVPAYDIFPAPPDIIAVSGVLARSTTASPAVGARLAGVLVERLRDALDLEFPGLATL